MVYLRKVGIGALVVLTALAMGLALIPDRSSAQAVRRPAKVKVDLIPDRVWVGQDCRIKVRLVRKGVGRLPGSLGGQTLLRVRVGKAHHDYSFKEVDPKGVLLKGAGAVTFTTPLRLRRKEVVTAVVDPLRRIPEIREGKANIIRLDRIPAKCLLSTVLGALELRKAYIKGRHLRLLIEYRPKAKLSRDQLRQVTLQVMSAGQKGSWPLSRVLARADRVKPGFYDFNTMFKAMPGASVRAMLADEVNKKQAVFTLSKPAAASSGSTKRVRARFKLPPAARAIVAQRARVKGGGRAKVVDRGVSVILPPGDLRFRPGETFVVTVRMNSGHPAGTLAFEVYQGRTLMHQDFGINTDELAYSGDRNIAVEMAVRIPEGVSGAGNYYIVARLTDEVWGFSDMFTVDAPVDWGPSSDVEVRVAAPNRTVTWTQGRTHMISWRVLGEYRGDPRFEVTLLDGDRRVRSINSADAVYHSNSRTYTLNWTIPEDVAAGSNYRIRVRDYNSGVSDISEEPFTITRAHDLLLDWPPTISDRPINIRMGETYVIRWTPVGNVNDRPIYINLNGPGYVRRLADIARGSRRQFVWNFGFNCTGRDWTPPGGGYFIRMMTDRVEPFRAARSTELQILVPTITYLNHGDRWTWRNGERVATRWSVRNMPEGKRVRIVLMKGTESWMDIASAVLASSGMYVWRVGTPTGTDFTSNMGGPGPPPPGCDYRLRVTMTDCFQVVAYSNYFCIE